MALSDLLPIKSIHDWKLHICQLIGDKSHFQRDIILCYPPPTIYQWMAYSVVLFKSCLPSIIMKFPEATWVHPQLASLTNELSDFIVFSAMIASDVPMARSAICYLRSTAKQHVFTAMVRCPLCNYITKAASLTHTTNTMVIYTTHSTVTKYVIGDVVEFSSEGFGEFKACRCLSKVVIPIYYHGCHSIMYLLVCRAWNSAD